jgi:hypothetical protein
MPESVECHSGYTYGERPVAFLWEGARIEVAEVLAHWRSPEGRQFRVRTTDSRLFKLVYREHASEWSIELL